MRIKDPSETGANTFVLDETLQPWKNAILSASLENLPSVVSAFKIWPCDRGTELSQWIPCLNKFDEFLAKATGPGHAASDLQSCVPILVFMELLTVNCNKVKAVFNSWDHLMVLVTCSNRRVVIETLSLAAALELKGGSTLKPSMWNAVMTVLCEGPSTLCASSQDDPVYRDFMTSDAFDPQLILRGIDFSYTCSDAEGTAYKITVPPISQADDPVAAAEVLLKSWDSENHLNIQSTKDKVATDKLAHHLLVFAFAVRTRVQLLHELWDKHSRIERLIVRLTASRACFESPRMHTSSVFSISQLVCLIDHPSTPQVVRIAATRTLSRAIEQKSDSEETRPEVMQLLAAPNPLYKWFVRSSLDAASGQNDHVSLRELAILINVVAQLCHVPQLASFMLNSGVISDIIPLIRIHPDFNHNIVEFACMIVQLLLDSTNHEIQAQAQRSIRTLDVTGTVLSVISAFTESVVGPLNACCQSSLTTLCMCLSHILRDIPGSDQRSLIRNGTITVLVGICQRRSWFGPSVFSSACHLMYSCLNMDPNSLQIMLEKGVVDLYLDAIRERSRVVVLSLHELPQLINAVCLTDAGRSRVEATDCISHMFMMCFEPDAIYLNASMHAKSLKQSVNELLRHHRPLVPIVTEVFRASVRAKFHLNSPRCRDQGSDQCIGLRNIIHCYFSMFSGASSFILESLHSESVNIIISLCDFAESVNQLPQFWVSSAAEVFMKFFGSILHIPSRTSSINSECHSAFVAKWSDAISKLPLDSHENFSLSASFSGVLLHLPQRPSLKYETPLIFCPAVNVLARCFVQKLKSDAESPVNLVDLFEDAETGSQHTRDVLKIFFLQNCETVTKFCCGLQNLNKVDRVSSSPAFSRIQMADVANTMLRSVVEVLKSCRNTREFAAVHSFTDSVKIHSLFYSFRLNFLRKVLQELMNCQKMILLGSSYSLEIHGILIDIFFDSYNALRGPGSSDSEDEVRQKRDRTGSPLNYRAMSVGLHDGSDAELSVGRLPMKRSADSLKEPSQQVIMADCDGLHSAIVGLISKFYCSLLSENVISHLNSPPSPWNDQSAEYLGSVVIGSLLIKNLLVQRVLNVYNSTVGSSAQPSNHAGILTSCYFELFAVCVADDDVVIFSSLKSGRYSNLSVGYESAFSERLTNLPSVFRSALSCVVYALTQSNSVIDSCFLVIRKMSQFLLLDSAFGKPFKWENWPDANRTITRCIYPSSQSPSDLHRKALEHHCNMIVSANQMQFKKVDRNGLMQEIMFPLDALCNQIIDQLSHCPSNHCRKSLVRCALFIAQSMSENVALLESSLLKIIECCLSDDIKPVHLDRSRDSDHVAPVLLIADILFNVFSRSKCSSDYLKQVATAMKTTHSVPVFSSNTAPPFVGSILKLALDVVSQSYLDVTLIVKNKEVTGSESFSLSVRVDVPQSVLFLSGLEQAQALSNLINSHVQDFSITFGISDPVVCTYVAEPTNISGNFIFTAQKEAKLLTPDSSFSVMVRSFPSSESMNAALQTTFRCVNLYGVAVVTPEYRLKFIRATLTPHINAAYPMFCNHCLWLYEVFAQEGTYLEEAIDRKIYECLHGASEGKFLFELFGWLGQLIYRFPLQVVASVKKLCLIMDSQAPVRYRPEMSRDHRVKLKRSDPRPTAAVWLPVYHFPGSHSALFVVSLCELFCEFSSHYFLQTSQASSASPDDELHRVGACWNPETIIKVLYHDFLNSADSKCHPLFVSVIAEKFMACDGNLLSVLANFVFQGRWSPKNSGIFKFGCASSTSFKFLKLLCDHSVPFRQTLLRKHISGICERFLALGHPDSKDFSVIAGIANFLSFILKRRSSSIPDKKITALAGEVVDLGLVNYFARIISALDNSVSIQRCLCDLLIQSSCIIAYEAAFSDPMNPLVRSDSVTNQDPRSSLLESIPADADGRNRSESMHELGSTYRGIESQAVSDSDSRSRNSAAAARPSNSERMEDDIMFSDAVVDEFFNEERDGHEENDHNEEDMSGSDVQEMFGIIRDSVAEIRHYAGDEEDESDSSSSSDDGSSDDDDDDLDGHINDDDDDDDDDNDDDDHHGDDDDEDEDGDDDADDDNGDEDGDEHVHVHDGDDENRHQHNIDEQLERLERNQRNTMVELAQVVQQEAQRIVQSSNSLVLSHPDGADDAAARAEIQESVMQDSGRRLSLAAQSHSRSREDEQTSGLPSIGIDMPNNEADWEDAVDVEGWFAGEDLMDFDAEIDAESRLIGSMFGPRRGHRNSAELSDFESDAAGDNPILNARSSGAVVIGHPMGRNVFPFPRQHMDGGVANGSEWTNPLLGSAHSSSFVFPGDSATGNRSHLSSEVILLNRRENRYGRTNPMLHPVRGNAEFSGIPQHWHVHSTSQSRRGDVEVACRVALELDIPQTVLAAHQARPDEAELRAAPLPRTNSAHSNWGSLMREHINYIRPFSREPRVAALPVSEVPSSAASAQAYRGQQSESEIFERLNDERASVTNFEATRAVQHVDGIFGLDRILPSPYYNPPSPTRRSPTTTARSFSSVLATRPAPSAASLFHERQQAADLPRNSLLMSGGFESNMLGSSAITTPNAGSQPGASNQNIATANSGLDATVVTSAPSGSLPFGTRPHVADERHALIRQAMNAARETIELSRMVIPGADSISFDADAASLQQNESLINEEERELREALALSLQSNGPPNDQEAGTQQVPMFQTPSSVVTPSHPTLPAQSPCPGTPSLSSHEISEIQGTDIDAAVLAELPVELRAGIIAQHRAVSRSNPTTPALGPTPTASSVLHPQLSIGAARLDVPDGVDPEYFNQLPPDVQSDVREQQRRARDHSNPVVNVLPALDLAATIASFPPSARADALLALPEEAILTLSRELQDEVRSLRGSYRSRQNLPDRLAPVARGQSASGVGHLPIRSPGRHVLAEFRRLASADEIDDLPREIEQSRHFRNVRMSMGNLSGAGYFHPAESDHVFSRCGRSVEAPLLRCPISPDIVSTIVSAGCIFSLRSTSRHICSLLLVSFFNPVCIAAFASACNQIFSSSFPEMHIANVHKLIRSVCSVATAHYEPIFFRCHARRLAALLDTVHPALNQSFVRNLLYQASSRAFLRPCLSDSLYIFSYVLLESLNRMGPNSADFMNSQHSARETIVRHVSCDDSIANLGNVVSSWLKSSEEPCEWIEPLDSALFLSIMRATSEPDSSDDDALELCSHLLRFHMRYDQFVSSFLPAVETHIVNLCDTVASNLSSCTSNFSIVQLPADDIRLVRMLLIMSNCFDANSVKWADRKGLTFASMSNSNDATFKPLQNILFRVSEHPVWVRVGVSLKEQELSSSSRRRVDGVAVVGEPAALFQSSGLARLHCMLESFFVIHKPMGKRFSDIVEDRAKLRGLRGANVARSEEMELMVRSDSTMGIGHIGHARSESSGHVSSSPPAQSSSASQSVEPSERDEFDSGAIAFVDFVFAHVNVINMLVRLKPSVINGSLSIMQRLPVLLDFENRKSLFRKELSKRDRLGGQIRSPLQLTVKRGQVYSDSFRHLNYRSSDELKAKLSVKFEGEEGADYGGLTREWYLVISREMLNPDIGLFVPSHGSKLAFQCNPASDIIFANEDFVHFRFVGRIVGKALYDNMLLDAHFTRAMYKAILRLPLSLSDVQDTEPEVFKSLHWLLHNDVSGLDLFFDTESEKFGVRETFELKEGGSGIPVTNENKAEYVKLLSEHRLRNSVRKQMQEFLDGFHELIPLDLIPMFSPAELELLMCGLPNVDREDLRSNTEYCGTYTRDSPQIQWFWRCVAEMSDEDTAKLVQFVTGTSNVPLEGFSALQGMHGPQRFQIHRSDRLDLLPTAHTCFNQLDLPAYGSFETLKSMILTAIR